MAMMADAFSARGEIMTGPRPPGSRNSSCISTRTSAERTKRSSITRRFSISSKDAFNHVDDPKPATTTLYATYTAELRSDQETYMLGLDKCYSTLQEANRRVDLLGHCNYSYRQPETKSAECDRDSGCLTVTWGRYDGQVRFLATAKRMEMLGEVKQAAKESRDTRSATAMGIEKSKDDAIALFFAETDLDIPEHVWAVAINEPVKLSKDESPAPKWARSSHARRLSFSGRSKVTRNSINTKKLATSLAIGNSSHDSFGGSQSQSQHAPLCWSIDSLHADSNTALARAKSAWNKNFKAHGRCKKLREHYGFARFTLKPAGLANESGGQSSDGTNSNTRDVNCVQIRIERVKVAPVGGIVSEFAEPYRLRAKGTRSFPAPPVRNVGGEIISTAAGRPTSFLNDIVKIANDSLGGEAPDLEELGLAFRIRREHEARLNSSLALDQRHSTKAVVQQKARSNSSIGDFYHALQRKPGMSDLKTGKLRKKVPTSKALLEAKARMDIAMEADWDEKEIDDADSISKAAAAASKVVRVSPRPARSSSLLHHVPTNVHRPPKMKAPAAPQLCSVISGEELVTGELAKGARRVGFDESLTLVEDAGIAAHYAAGGQKHGGWSMWPTIRPAKGPTTSHRSDTFVDVGETDKVSVGSASDTSAKIFMLT